MKFRKPAPLSRTHEKPVANHRLPASAVVLRFEDAAQFEALRESLDEQLRPATALEEILVDDIASAKWRLRRAETCQDAYINSQLAAQPGEDPMALMEKIATDKTMRAFEKWAATHRRAYESAWRRLAALQKGRKKEERVETATEARAGAQPREHAAAPEFPPVIGHRYEESIVEPRL